MKFKSNMNIFSFDDYLLVQKMVQTTNFSKFINIT